MLYLPQGNRAFSRRAALSLTASAAASLGNRPGEASDLATTDSRRPRSVILIFNSGAPSHLDLWDPKPEATDTVRGPFGAITTNVAGSHVTELLPKVATRMDKLAVVKTVHHNHSSHNAGMYWSIVGQPYPKDSTHITPSANDHPSFGTLISWLAQRDGYSGAVPPYVLAPFPQCDSGLYITPGQFGGCLGKTCDPFVFDSDGSTSVANVQNLTLSAGMTTQRFQQRLGLLGRVSSAARSIPSGEAAAIDVFRKRSASIVLSGKAAQAFDLSQEPASVRERYGRHSWGQSHLLARRLIESGSRFVTCVNGRSIIWDTHTDNFKRLQNDLVPPMEQAYVALLDELEERGLLETTLVVWMGDFGRTPKINKNAGRDHWPGCYSIVLAGGGIRGGQTIGKSDSIGAYPEERPVTPADIHATVFTALGYDYRQNPYEMADGRPMPLTNGRPIPELFA